MAETIGQYQVSTYTTPANSSALSSSVVRGNLNTGGTAHNGHDADGGIHLQSSALASRPVAGTVGRKWLTTDGLRLYYDTGAVWSEIAYLSLAAGGTVAGAVTLSAAGTALAVTNNVTIGGTLAVTGAITATGGVVGAVTGNASTATALQTSRTIWGQSFNGSANVSGALSGATTGDFASNVTVGGILDVAQILRARDRIQLRRASLSLDLTFAKYWDGTGLPLTDAIGDILALGNAGGDGLVLVNANAVRQRFHNSGGISLLDSTDPGAGVVRVAGALAVTGTVTGGTYNGQTISSSASFTGNVTVATNLFLNNANLFVSPASLNTQVVIGTGGVTRITVADATTTIANALAVTGAATFNGNVTLGDATADTVTVTGRLASGLTWATDNTNDIGAAGANRPRDVFVGRNLAVASDLTVSGIANITTANVGAASPVLAWNTSTPSGGNTDARVLLGIAGPAHVGLYWGSGAPTVSAAQGSLYIRTDGSSTSTRLYVNTNGSTGWTNFTSAT